MTEETEIGGGKGIMEWQEEMSLRGMERERKQAKREDNLTPQSWSALKAILKLQ